MRALRPLAMLLLGFALSACGVEQPIGLPGTPGVPAAFQGEWDQIQLAPWNTRFQGDRRVSIAVDLDNGEQVQTQYMERVSSDGTGRFNILPLYAESQVFPDEPTFLTLQGRREGFFYRYRDFRIRDLSLFRENYRHLGAGSRVEVAGRTAWEVTFLRNTPRGRTYVVAFDLVTGLVLRCKELDARGNLLSGLEYTSIDFDPELSGVAFFVPGNDEQRFEFDGGEGEEVLGFTPRLPESIPAGFVLHETASVTDGMGLRWFKAGYTDGAEMLFFLYRERTEGRYELPLTVSPQSSSTQAASTESSAGPERRDEVVLFRAGTVHAAQGTVRGHDMIVIGEVPEHDLLQMIHTTK